MWAPINYWVPDTFKILLHKSNYEYLIIEGYKERVQ
jgi:hypothetical protein